MSKSVSWLAITTTEPQLVLNALNLVDTGERVSRSKDGMLCARLSNGTLLIRIDEFYHPIIEAESIASIAHASFVMTFCEYEGLNTSMASLYKQGQPFWQVVHCQEQGDDHLDITGAAPRGLQQLYNTARHKRQQHGNDAVYGVPAALAESICGFNDNHPDTMYTRLELQSEYGGGNSARWQHMLRAQSKEALPDDARGRCRLFCSVLRPLLLKAGFSEAIDENDLPFFRREEDPYSITVDIGADGKFYPRNGVLNIFVNHYEVQRILEAMGREDAKRNTASLYVVRMLHGALFPITSQAELADFVALIEKGLPNILERCTHIEGLDQLVNGDRTYYDMAQTDAQLVLAYLASNPNYQALIDNMDGRLIKSWQDRIGYIRRLDQYLRENVTPLTPNKAV